MSEEASRKLSERRNGPRWAFAWIWISLVSAALLPVQSALAAETYANFVVRINHSLPDGSRFRADLEEQLLRAANEYRVGRGLKPLKRAAADLAQAARAHAADMMQGEFVGHTSTSGAGFESRMRALHPGVMVLPRMAENAARERSKGAADAAKAGKLFQQWVKSSAHAKTMRSRDYIAVATGVVEKDEKLYAVQIFMGPEVKTNMFGAKPQKAADENETLY